MPLTLTKVLRCFAELGAVLKAAERKDAQARKAQAEEARLSPLCSVPVAHEGIRFVPLPCWIR
eukprot:scaffold57305_cov50-Phaeocystis_antarctica.AAC.1